MALSVYLVRLVVNGRPAPLLSDRVAHDNFAKPRCAIFAHGALIHNDLVGVNAMTQISITELEFRTVYQPIHNHLTEYAPIDWGDGFGTMFETFGKELEFVRSQATGYVWTYLSSDGYDCVVSGYHFVNRLGYFVTQVPVSAGEFVLVELEP